MISWREYIPYKNPHTIEQNKRCWPFGNPGMTGNEQRRKTRITIFNNTGRREKIPNTDTDLITDIDPALVSDQYNSVGVIRQVTALMAINAFWGSAIYFRLPRHFATLRHFSLGQTPFPSLALEKSTKSRSRWCIVLEIGLGIGLDKKSWEFQDFLLTITIIYFDSS